MEPIRGSTSLTPKQPTQLQELGLSVEVLHMRMPSSLKPSNWRGIFLSATVPSECFTKKYGNPLGRNCAQYFVSQTCNFPKCWVFLWGIGWWPMTSLWFTQMELRMPYLKGFSDITICWIWRCSTLERSFFFLPERQQCSTHTSSKIAGVWKKWIIYSPCQLHQ